jgi:peptidoglycan/LPS O-acetylase OafA/YrhL
MTTLQDRLDACKGVGPGFHFMRHALAFTILFHHTYVLTFGGQGNTGYVKGQFAEQAANLTTKQILIELLRPGLFSLVGAFFCLSGFLVIGSALRSRHAGRFLWFRIIRITPALCVEVTLSAILLGAIFTTLDLRTYFSSDGFHAYFANILGDVHYFLPGVFTTNPMPDIVNVNLWTLPAEFYCYLCMLVMMLTGVIYHRLTFNLLVAAAVLFAAAAPLLAPDHFSSRVEATHYTEWFVVYLFFVGILFYLNADRIIMHRLVLVAAIAIYWVLTIFHLADALAGLCLAYGVVYFGTTSFKTFDRFVKGDYSYGIYLYGYPITQGVIAALLPRIETLHGVTRFLLVAPLAFALTLCFAYLSWHGIEKRMLRFKNLVFAPKAPPALLAQQKS